MPDTTNTRERPEAGAALVVGASRNIGLGVAEELAGQGWTVTGTSREKNSQGLTRLAARFPGRVEQEQVDITDPGSLHDLRARLASRRFDLVLVNAGIPDQDVPVRQVDAEAFTRVMLTNALGPMHAVEALADLVPTGGTIAVTSSRQGSVSRNTRGGHEVYRASKAALNQLMRSYAARGETGRTLLLVHPGWVQTELGGPGAPLTVEESAPGVVSTILAHAGEPGLQFRDYQDEVVPW